MKSLPTLIKLHRSRLDEKRRQLVELQKSYAEMEEMKARVEASYKQELELAVQNPTDAYTFGAYSKRTKKTQSVIKKTLSDLQLSMDFTTREIAEIYGEVKRYEILKDIHDERLLKEQVRLEQIMLDEIGMESHRRKQADVL